MISIENVIQHERMCQIYSHNKHNYFYINIDNEKISVNVFLIGVIITKKKLNAKQAIDPKGKYTYDMSRAVKKCKIYKKGNL